MELELGLKITKTVDDVHSTDFRIAKDREGLVFLFRETETMFILTAHLNGYKRENVKININKEGTAVSINGEKPVQEMVMNGWIMYKKEPELRGFEKMFRIPGCVILDRIKAKYNEEESTLTIYMPKVKNGVVGEKMEELSSNKITGQSETREEEEEVCNSRSEEVNEEEEEERENGDGEGGDSEEKRGGGKMKKLFGPCFFMGSALIASLVVLVVGLVRSKKQRHLTE